MCFANEDTLLAVIRLVLLCWGESGHSIVGDITGSKIMVCVSYIL